MTGILSPYYCTIAGFKQIIVTLEPGLFKVAYIFTKHRSMSEPQKCLNLAPDSWGINLRSGWLKCVHPADTVEEHNSIRVYLSKQYRETVTSVPLQNM